MNISDVGPILDAAKIADDSVLMEGLHGIGKSEIVKSYCTENGYFYTALFLSHQEVGDLIGIPVTEMRNGESIQYWSKPVWLQRMEEASSKGMHCVLLLDELNRAQTDVLNSALQLVLERQIHEHILPQLDGVRTQIIACTNPASDGDYQVQEFDPALLDRFLKLEVEVDVEGWLRWARANNVNAIIRDFVANNPTKLHFVPEDQSQTGATPRSYTKLASFVDIFDTLPEESIFNIIRGKIGSALGAQFYTFYNEYNNNISVKDIEAYIKKTWKKQEKTGLDIEKLGEDVKAFTDKMESITKLEHLNVIYEKYSKQFGEPGLTFHAVIPLFGLLYSLELEILTSFLKDKKANDKENFYAMMKLDVNRALAKRIKSKVVKG